MVLHCLQAVYTLKTCLYIFQTLIGGGIVWSSCSWIFSGFQRSTGECRLTAVFSRRRQFQNHIHWSSNSWICKCFLRIQINSFLIKPSITIIHPLSEKNAGNAPELPEVSWRVPQHHANQWRRERICIFHLSERLIRNAERSVSWADPGNSVWNIPVSASVDTSGQAIHFV